MFGLTSTDQQCLFGMGHDAAYTLTLASQQPHLRKCHSDHNSFQFHSSLTPNLQYPQFNKQYNIESHRITYYDMV